MRRQSAVALIAAGLLLGCAAIRASAEDAPQQGESSKAAPTSSDQGKGEQAVGSKSGQNGKEEPGSHGPSANMPVFVNGKLDVPGAPADSQTVPAKFSQHNDAVDHTPIMAMSLSLTDEQKTSIAASVKLADKPVQSTRAKPVRGAAVGHHDPRPAECGRRLLRCRTSAMSARRTASCWCGRATASWSARSRAEPRRLAAVFMTDI